MSARSPSSWRVPIAWAALALGAGVCPDPLRGQAVRTEVAEVRFEGNQAFPDDSLARAIVTRETECRSAVFQPLCWTGTEFAIKRAYLPRRELPRDLLRLRIWYRRRGFRETEVDTLTSLRPDGRVEVTFRVNEGLPVAVGSLDFVGVEELQGIGLLNNLPLQVGDRLSTITLDATRDTLIRRLANRGYARADVLRSYFIPRTDPHLAEVTFDVAAGPRARYGHVSVEGNESLSESTVLRTLQFRAGDIYRVDQLTQAQARLFGLEIIRSASVIPNFEEGPDSVIPVEVAIREGDVHRVRAGAGWSSSECLDTEARWVSRDFFGGGRRLQVRGRVSNLFAGQFKDLLCPQSGEDQFAEPNWLASVEFSQPWIFSTRNSFQASLFAERQSLPDVFIREAVGLSVALTRAIGPRTPLTLAYRPELSRLDAAEVLFCTSFLVCTPRDVEILQGANWLAPLDLTFARNLTNNVLNPSSGYTLFLGLEHAASWTGSNFGYQRAVTEWTRYKRITGGGTVLATRLRLGWVGAGAFEELLGREGEADLDIVHPQKRFYAGGANSVRGFAQNRLGPRVLTADVLDLLRPPSSGGAGCAPEEVIALTCDASPVDEARLFPRPTGGTRLVEGSVEFRIPMSSSFQMATFADFGRVWSGAGAGGGPASTVTPGVGLRYLSPIGPLRVDLAYRSRGGEDLSVITSQLRPFRPGQDAADQRVVVNGTPLPFVATNQLAVLGPQVLYGDSSPGSLRRFQLHISIGQAF